ncbi:hypothetical protein DMENIID0001_035810 [Sergentomyia squamirostris]
MFFVNSSGLVTGGTGAIGGAICEDLLKSGVKNLAVIDIHKDEPSVINEWKTLFPKSIIRYFCVDVGSPDDLKKCYEQYTKEIESLDIVANCAGIFNENNFKSTIDINLGGVVSSTLLAMEYMRKDNGKGKGGVILNISSVAGVNVMSTNPIYCASKVGVIAFTRGVAHNRDYLGIKFLTLCPAGTQSTLYDGIFDGTKNIFKGSQEQVDYIRDAYPPQSPVEVSKAALKIMQDATNGSVWLIDLGHLSQITDLPKIIL